MAYVPGMRLPDLDQPQPKGMSDGEVQGPLTRHPDRPGRRPAPVSQPVLHVAERRSGLRARGCRHACRSTDSMRGGSSSHFSSSPRVTLVVLTESDRGRDVRPRSRGRRSRSALVAPRSSSPSSRASPTPHPRGRATRSSRSRVRSQWARTSTGPQRGGSTSRSWRKSAAGSGQLLDEQGSVLTRSVVVLGDSLDLEPERLVKRQGALVQR